ncbi:site-specific integrase [Xanthomonas massiliensis]|uniref:site-specific integrase n=1 Tax=Xanthomonas massiliensis TaxID=1720302 RepID=UPI000824039C|nr:site-specific integrase [Xanthomonas massiliensis]
MASFHPRPGGWQAQIRHRGRPPISRTFKTKADAQAWANQIESEIARGVYRDRSQAERFTLGEILIRYGKEVSPLKKSADAEASRIAFLLRYPIAQIRLSDLRPTDIADFRDCRLQEVTGSTVIRDLTLISHAINIARKEWGIVMENPCTLIRRPKENKPRKRRLSPKEEQRLLAELELSQRTPEGTWLPGGCRNEWMKPLVIMAIETAMRRGELLQLKWTDVFLEERFVRLDDSKNGHGRDVPLSSRAAAVLADLPRDPSGRVFPVTGEALKQSFTRAAVRAGLGDLHFHDLRHEATSRIAPKLGNVLELSAVTGHMSLQMLKRYFHPIASELARKLG